MKAETTDKKSKSLGKKIWNCATWAVLVALLAVVFYALVGTLVAKSQKKQFYFFGYTFNVVVTGSMIPEINIGDMVICKKTTVDKITAGEIEYDENKNLIKNGDYIIFTCRVHQYVPTTDGGTRDIYGEPIIHKAIKKVVNENGEIEIYTQGVNNSSPDSWAPVKADNLIGVMVVKSEFLGKTARFFQNGKNIVFILIFLVILECIYLAIKNIIKIKKASVGAENGEDLHEKALKEVLQEMENNKGDGGKTDGVEDKEFDDKGIDDKEIDDNDAEGAEGLGGEDKANTIDNLDGSTKSESKNVDEVSGEKGEDSNFTDSNFENGTDDKNNNKKSLK